MIALAAARTNQRTVVSNCTDLTGGLSRSTLIHGLVGVVLRFVVIIYRGTSGLLYGVSFISVAELQFLLYM